MNFWKKIRTWCAMPTSRRIQWLAFKRDRLITRIIYNRRLLACGKATIVERPLFWTPEYIELGEGVLIWRGCRIEAINSYAGNCFHPRISFGDRTSFQQNCHITAAGELSIGNDCTFSVGVLVTDIDHEYEAEGKNVLAQPLIVRTTRIGKNCFIGAGAVIQAGTQLGDQCIVGANAVVRGNFPDYSVIAGVPARIIKRRNPATGEWQKTNTEGNFSK